MNDSPHGASGGRESPEASVGQALPDGYFYGRVRRGLTYEKLERFAPACNVRSHATEGLHPPLARD
jgi:hypothetical protein